MFSLSSLRLQRFQEASLPLSTATSLQIVLRTEEQAIEQPQEATPAWKHQVAERLAAHRSRRHPAPEGQPDLPMDLGPTLETAESRAARIAAAVAARYAQLPSYREILAAQAESAARQAEAAAAAARAAALSAEAASVAQQALLAGLDAMEEMEEASAVASTAASTTETAEGPQLVAKPEVLLPAPAAEASEAFYLTAPPVAGAAEAVAEAPAAAEEEELFTVEPVEDPIPLSANLIEFPRQLVAARKARPRLAEGPLHDPEATVHDASQLRIFEVEPEQVSRQPLAGEQLASTAPDWNAIRLDDLAESPEAVLLAEPEHGPELGAMLDLPPQTASLELRLMSGIVDLCLVLGGCLLFAVVFVASTAHPPAMKPALIGGAVALFAFFLLYELLFFTFAEATPGMRYAHIALCTFDDQNPTRAAMRRRIGALLLSALPLGLGIVWAWVDSDRLGWHDRITRMYQRSY
jgi:uncharacterized RDD family membrane protein YckC